MILSDSQLNDQAKKLANQVFYNLYATPLYASGPANMFVETTDGFVVGFKVPGIAGKKFSIKILKNDTTGDNSLNNDEASDNEYEKQILAQLNKALNLPPMNE